MPPMSLGIMADSGAPLAPIGAQALNVLAGHPAESAVQSESIQKKAADAKQDHLGVQDGIDPEAMHEAGWAILYGRGVSQEIKDALRPLIDHRRAQVNNDTIFKIFEGDDTYKPGDTASDWLKRKRIRMTDVVPLKGVPYYVMIVAAPDDVPFEFQYGLDLYWAVGRIWFPTVDEFAQYAASVVKYETMATVPTSRQMAIYGTRNEGDAATGLVTDFLIHPMIKGDAFTGPFGKKQQFVLNPFIDGAATKDTLSNIFSGSISNGPPALLFTGSHGLVFPPAEKRQELQQGAIVCQEWVGSTTVGPTRKQYFPAQDLPSDTKVHGMVHFIFACYGGGWPQFDSYDLSSTPAPVGPRPAMARLPQTLMARPDGCGALAVLAHIDRAWTASFQDGADDSQVDGFRVVVERMMAGSRLGQATDKFNLRWAVLSTDLADILESKSENRPVDNNDLIAKWIARDDARNYVLYGDPAVRLRVEDMPVIS
jgi:hypothetical protein